MLEAGSAWLTPLFSGDADCARMVTMTEKLQDNPILRRFRAALDEIYGERLERVVLFGSRVRGDAHEESDYDVAVFLRNYTPGTPTELYRLADLSTKIIVEEDGPFIHAMPYPAGFYNDPREPLMYAIRTEGIDL
jgi:predicted nucleotidyltransferase